MILKKILLKKEDLKMQLTNTKMNMKIELINNFTRILKIIIIINSNKNFYSANITLLILNISSVKYIDNMDFNN